MNGYAVKLPEDMQKLQHPVYITVADVSRGKGGKPMVKYANQNIKADTPFRSLIITDEEKPKNPPVKNTLEILLIGVAARRGIIDHSNIRLSNIPRKIIRKTGDEKRAVGTYIPDDANP